MFTSVPAHGVSHETRPVEPHSRNDMPHASNRHSLTTRLLNLTYRYGLGTVEQALIAGQNFLVLLVAGKMLSVDSFAVFVLVVSALTLAFSISTSFVSTPVLVLLNRRFDSTSADYIRKLGTLNILVSVMVGFLTLFLARIFIPRLQWIDIVSGTLFLTAWCGYELKRKLSFATGATTRRLVATSLLVVTTMLVFGGCAFVARLTSPHLLLALAAAYAIGSLVFLSRSPRAPSERVSWKMVVQNHWSYAHSLALSLFLYWISSQGYFLLAARLVPDEGLGAARTAQNLVGMITICLLVFENHMTPAAARIYEQGGVGSLQSWVAGVFRSLTIPFVVFVTASAVVAYVLHRWIYSREFAAFSYLTLIFAFHQLLHGMNRPYTVALKAVERTRSIFWGYALSAVVTLPVALTVIPLVGAAGIAIGFVVSAALLLMVLHFSFWNSPEMLPCDVISPEPSSEGDPLRRSHPVRHRRRIIFAGPFPWPITGQTLSTEGLFQICRDEGLNLVRCNIVRGNSGMRVVNLLVRARRVLSTIFAIVWNRLRGASHMYLSVDANAGMYVSTFLAGVGRVVGYQLVLHYHSFSHLETRVRRMTWLARVSGKSAVHVHICEYMSNVARQHYPEICRTGTLSNVFLLSAKPEAAIIPATARFRIGFLGRLTREKGAMEAMDVFERLTEAGNSVSLVLAGPKSDQDVSERIRQLSDRYPAEQFHAPGHLDAPGKDEFYRNLDVFLFPTNYRNETQGIVNVEAMSYGVPVIANGRCCVRSDVGAEGGVIVPESGDYVSTAVRTISDWIADPHESAGRRARALAQFGRLKRDSASELKIFSSLLLGYAGDTNP